MQSPFATYRGGFQVLPQGWMEVATEPGRNYAKGIQALGSSLISAAGSLAEGMEQKAINKEAAPTLMSQYEQMSQATGQEMDPTIVDRYSNLDNLSGAGLQQLNKDLTGAMGFQQNIYNIGRQRQMEAMQMEAYKRAAAARQAQEFSNSVGNMLMGRNTPAVQSYAAPAPAAPAYQQAPANTGFYFSGVPATGLMPALPGTIQGVNMGIGNQ